MPVLSRKAALKLSSKTKKQLRRISRSRNIPASWVERSKILLAYADGVSIALIVKRFGFSRSKVNRTVDRALCFGAITALEDLPRCGRPHRITKEAATWLVSMACKKPKELGYSHELWTCKLLAQHLRQNCNAAGHPSLRKIAKGTVSTILRKNKLQPHKVRYYLENRDPEFDAKSRKVLSVYKEAAREKREPEKKRDLVFISFDEKPGIQAVKNTAPDLSPLPGQYPCWSRDHEYKRLGTMSLLAGIDLVNGKAHHLLADRHRSKEFIIFLKGLIANHPKQTRFRIILDNHSAHVSKETQSYLKTVPNRFDFIFTPKHSSWLNLIEVFFSSMSRTVLRSIRVGSKDELKKRIDQYFVEINKAPVVYNWSYMLGRNVKQKSELRFAA